MYSIFLLHSITRWYLRQVGAIRMTADNVEASLTSLVVRTDGKRHNRGMLDSVVVLSTRFEHTAAEYTGESLKASSFEFGHGVLHGVERVGGSREKGTGFLSERFLGGHAVKGSYRKRVD